VQGDVGDQAEVEQHDAAVVPDHHVGRLDVAMDLAGAVQEDQRDHQLAQRLAQARLVEAGVGAAGRPLLGGLGLHRERMGVGRVRQRGRDVDRGRRRRAEVPDVAEEVDALDQLHREEPVALGVVQLAEGGEVGVREALQDPELALEAVQEARIAPAQHLERDPHLELAVEGLVDLAHATGAEESDDLEPLCAFELVRGNQVALPCAPTATSHYTEMAGTAAR
jgi:hypothetical protein